MEPYSSCKGCYVGHGRLIREDPMGLFTMSLGWRLINALMSLWRCCGAKETGEGGVLALLVR